MRGLNRVDPQSAPASTNGQGAQSSGLAELYDREISTQADIRQIEAVAAASAAGTDRLAADVRDIPADDPFLQGPRVRAADARRNYEYLINGEQLAPDNPRVLMARHRLVAAEAELERQKQSLQRHLTSDGVALEAKLQGLRARLTAIKVSILAAERRLPARRERTIEMDLMEREIEFAAARLKQAEIKGAELRLTAVSSKSRLSVVDTAVPPESSQPGIVRALLLSAVPVLLLLLIHIGWNYLRQVRQRAILAIQLATAPLQNGTHAHALAGETSGAKKDSNVDGEASA
jgi:hypothetical protein